MQSWERVKTQARLVVRYEEKETVCGCTSLSRWYLPHMSFPQFYDCRLEDDRQLPMEPGRKEGREMHFVHFVHLGPGLAFLHSLPKVLLTCLK